jgi:cell division protease FtsH
MSDAIGPIALESDGGRTLFGRGVDDKQYSEQMSAKIDEEVKLIMNNALAKAREVLTTHRPILDEIAKKLMEVETLEQKEYEEILKKNNIPLKKKDTPAVDVVNDTK